MLTNPVNPTSAAQTDSERPTLRIAARPAPAGEDAPPAAAGRIRQEVSGWHTEWRRTLETVRTTLAGLEQACESAIDTQQAEAASLIDRLVQDAAADAATAAATLERAQSEISDLQQGSMVLQATVEKVQAALSDEQDTVKRLNAQLELDVAARVRAETERDELRRECKDRVAAAEAQAEALRAKLQAQKAELSSALQQLDAAVIERSKLASTFRLVQRALALNVLENIAEPAEDGARTADSRPEPDPHSRPADLGVAHATPATVVEAAADPHSPLIAAPVEAVEDVERVLAQIEVLYLEDVASGRSGLELADRLTASIRHARSVIASRWSAGDFDPQALFDHLIGLLLSREAATSFGRHLSIAAYSARTPWPAPSAPEAS